MPTRNRHWAGWMSRVPGCALGLAAAAMIALPLPAAADGIRITLETVSTLPRPSGSLVERLELWLDARTDWPRRAAPPRIEVISGLDLARMLGGPRRGFGRARGLYDAETQTVFLARPWDPDRPEHVSVLLHELVHHRQAPHHWYCPAAQELPAYRLQEAWLAAHGLELEVNWIAIVLEAGCTRSDIHPD